MLDSGIEKSNLTPLDMMLFYRWCYVSSLQDSSEKRSEWKIPLGGPKPARRSWFHIIGKFDAG
ncbi:hypothetical protein BKH29_12200 [Actinomyces oris]|uniref:Uncharacterized protein n=1 Tax=Actinomyces oris TaxID=544580 RepID=A0A1Q8V4P7_9ACTO|nr:hypothetical protein BKH29_12200 [Actinomyces oris]